jgi:hypothetical protein
VLLANANIIRKQYYKADAALEAYDAAQRAATKLQPPLSTTLRERLREHAGSLSEYQPFFASDGELASTIVEIELGRDCPATEGAVRYVLREAEIEQRIGPADPPILRTDRAELEGKVEYLKNRFGPKPLQDAIKLLPKPKDKGHPKMWHQIRLFTLWFLIQHVGHLKNINIRNACKRIQAMGGVFEYINEKGVAWSKVASEGEQIRRLYYDADRAFGEFERTIRSKFVPDYQSRPFKHQLRALAREISNREIIIIPVLSLAIRFVLRLLREDGVCRNHTIDCPDTGYEVDTTKARFLPDEKGHWIMKGIRLSEPYPLLDNEEWKSIFRLARLSGHSAIQP